MLRQNAKNCPLPSCIQRPNTMFENNTLVRYNNRIYRVFANYDIIDFVEYHVAKISQKPTQDADFTLYMQDRLYRDFKHDDPVFQKTMYEKVLAGAKILPSESEAEAEYLDCLRSIYRDTVVTQGITQQDIEERECIHRSRVRSRIDEALMNMARFVYRLAATGKEIGVINTHCPETYLTEEGRLPILWAIHEDPSQRTYAEYLRHIFTQEFVGDSGKAEEDMGPVLVALYSQHFPSLRFTYQENPKTILPTIFVTIDVGKSEVLM